MRLPPTPYPARHGTAAASRLLGRPINTPRANAAVRCVRVAQELRTGPMRSTSRSTRAAREPAQRGDGSTLAFRAAEAEAERAAARRAGVDGVMRATPARPCWIVAPSRVVSEPRTMYKRTRML